MTQVLVEMSPGLPIDKHILSPASLARGDKKPACFSPRLDWLSPHQPHLTFDIK